MLIDTHCHIHDDAYTFNITDVIEKAKSAGVEKIVCIGTDMPTSQLAINVALENPEIYATIGVHPHEVSLKTYNIETLLPQDKIVAVGEIGLDYFYNHSPREAQIKALEYQLDVAIKHNLPVVFHVRDAFDDFWPILDNMTREISGFKGVLHSFTDNQKNLDEALKRGLYIGVNGISTFTKDEAQKHVFRNVPLDNLLFETDAPYLTPAPFRGSINEPAFVKNIAEFHASERNISLSEISAITTANAKNFYKI